MTVVIVGGGWAGCSAAYAAAVAGADTVIIEKTDMLLGTGLVGGIMRNNGRLTAMEEMRELGAGNFLKPIEQSATHHNIDFPGHRHAMLYDVTRIEPLIKMALRTAGVKLKLQKRMAAVSSSNGFITGIKTGDGEHIKGDVFIDCTGTAGPSQYCTLYGSGCAMCILRCPTFGPRTSLTAKAGITEITAGEGFPQFEAMSGSCKLEKKSISTALVAKLERDGVLVIPLPEILHASSKLDRKACQQYSLPEFAENLVFLDTGHAKLMAPYFPLEILRTLKGLEDARYADPYSGGMGNSVRFMAMAPCNDSLVVSGALNLLCAGEKTGLLVGHTEAIVTGFLAGHNAVRMLAGSELLVLPPELACGDIISFMHREMKTPEGISNKYTFSGSVYFQRMQERGLYTTDMAQIRERVARTGLAGVFNRSII
ncbi:MAG: FAD-dependent oxidoreductase [Desulfotomaculaceae bacterium]|nr:FAD-dependent oxidoreductase [Desulfotomaculaceae bacterium]